MKKTFRTLFSLSMVVMLLLQGCGSAKKADAPFMSTIPMQACSMYRWMIIITLFPVLLWAVSRRISLRPKAR